MVGEVIDHYKILERIGEGGMGTVYRALDTLLEREVALKLLRTDLSDQPDVSQRFRAEAVALARLSHPHIATLFGLVRRDTQLCMVMELVRGETLANLMKAEPAFACDRAVRLAMQILAALDYAHESGIVHRDVKPSNVIVAPSGVAKVLDFGIARVLDSDRMTRQGLIVGTPQYMAPEQIRGDPIDGRADVYAVGVLLYELIAGRFPFKADTGVGLMYAHLEGTATPLVEVAPHAPSWLADLIHRTLAKSPADRFRAGELRQALDEGLSAGIVARPNAATSALPVAPAVRVVPPVTDFGATELDTAPQPTDMQATILRGATPPRPLPAASTPVDVFREPLADAVPTYIEPPAPAPAPTRTWIAAGVLALAALAAGAFWVLQSGTTPDATSSSATGPAAAAPVSGGSASPSSAPTSATAAKPTLDRPLPPMRPAERAAGDAAASSGPPSKDATGTTRSTAAGGDARTSKPATPAPPDASDRAESEPPLPPAAALPAATFADVVLLVPADKEYEEVEVRVTFHPERFVVFDVDAGRIVSQVFYRKPVSNPAAAVLLGRPRLLTGSERWFILPTSAGEIVLRLDLDSSGDIVLAFEARSGMRVSRQRGEFGG